MSNEKKTALLNENTTRRFWKLANIGAINEMGYDFGRDDEPLEEQDEELEMDEEVPMEDEEVPMDAELPPEPEMDAPEEGGVEAEVSIPESDVAALETAREVIDQILGAANGGEAEAGLGDEEELAPVEDEIAPEEEELPLEENEITEEEELDEDKLEEVVKIITDRVASKILREALLRRVKK